MGKTQKAIFALKANQLGSSIIELLIYAGMLSGMALTMAQLSSHTDRISTNAIKNSTITELNYLLHGTYSNPDCMELFRGLNLELPENIPTNPISISAINLGGQSTVLHAGDKYQGVNIDSITLKRKGLAFGNPNGVFPYEINVAVSKSNSRTPASSFLGSNTRNLTIQANMQTEVVPGQNGNPDTRKIIGCGYGNVSSGTSTTTSTDTNTEISSNSNLYPSQCKINFGFQESSSTSPVRDAELNLDGPGYVGIRMKGRVNAGDKFSISPSCNSPAAGSLSEYVAQNCEMGIGQHDLTAAAPSNPDPFKDPFEVPDQIASSAFGSTPHGSSEFTFSGWGNNDDSLYTYMKCSAPSNPAMQAYFNYVKSNCSICIGQSDNYRPQIQNINCAKVSDTVKWQRVRIEGSMDSTDLIFLGFQCGNSPLITKSIRWN